MLNKNVIDHFIYGKLETTQLNNRRTLIMHWVSAGISSEARFDNIIILHINHK